MRRVTVLLLGATLILVGGSGSAPAAGAPQKERVIVVLRDGVGDPAAVAREHERRYGGITRIVYEHALKGYAADLPPAARNGLARDPRVAYLEADQTAHAFAELPTGLDRVEAEQNSTARIDGVDQRVDVDVAILDTGIAAHPDLNIAGGTRCVGLVLGLFARCSGTTFTDGHGHGTHVAGTVAALDNGAGVVGMAPGARLWAVKVLSDTGSGFISEIVAGVDWVTGRASSIEVANMSLGAAGASRALNDALTRSTNAGVVYAVAAGNDQADAAGYSPASHPQVITVSAMADFNGAAGGGAAPTCRADVDDTLADFSNYGSVVDIAAPGVCITSTWLGGGYNTISGTSMASPHVAGAAALYVVEKGVTRSSTRWSTVRNGLRSEWAVPQSSPCGFSEGRSGEPMLLLAGCSA
jgi:subtilisin